MAWDNVLSSVAGGLLGPLGDLLFGGLDSLERAGTSGWIMDNYGPKQLAFEKQQLEQQYDITRKAMNKQYDLNLWLMEDQYSMQEEFYNMYQSPSAMMRQYQDAGLNPALMIGNGASASGGSGTAVSPQGVSAPTPSSSGSGIIAIMAALGAVKNAFSQARLNSALAKKADAETENIPFLRELSKSQSDWYKQQSDESKARIENIGKQNEKLAAEVIKISADAKLSEASTDKILVETEQMSARFGSELTLLQENIRKVQSEVANMDEDTRLKKYQEILTDSQTFKTINEGLYYKQMEELTSGKVTEQLYLNAYVLPLQEALVSAGISEKESQALLNDSAAALNNKESKVVYLRAVSQAIRDGLIGVAADRNSRVNALGTVANIASGGAFGSRTPAGF